MTRVVIRAVVTNPSIEESIRPAEANQMRLEAMPIHVPEFPLPLVRGGRLSSGETASVLPPVETRFRCAVVS